MTRNELVGAILELDIPSDSYSFDGPGGGECYAVEADGCGWITYYSERGEKKSKHFFSTESEANEDLMARLRVTFH